MSLNIIFKCKALDHLGRKAFSAYINDERIDNILILNPNNEDVAEDESNQAESYITGLRSMAKYLGSRATGSKLTVQWDDV